MEKKLFVLPFDHRSSFAKGLLGIQGQPTDEEVQQIRILKHLVYEGFRSAWKIDTNPEELALLVDTQYGRDILEEAEETGIQTITCVEKSGKRVLELEGGESFADRLDGLNLSYLKALVRYLEPNTDDRSIQNKRLSLVSAYAKEHKIPLIVEVLIPQEVDDEDSRTQKTIEMLEGIREHADVAIWKLEGRSADMWKKLLETIPDAERIIVLGRGEDELKVREWLKIAKQFDKIVGFAIGRTVFSGALKGYLNRDLTVNQARDIIANKYRSFLVTWRGK